MTRMYAGAKGKIAGLISFIEEIIPFTDFVPTFTILWIYTNFIERPSVQDSEFKVQDSKENLKI